jgi:hypothetical protein
MSTFKQTAMKVLTCVAAFAAVGWIDYELLFYQISISPVYFLCVGYVTWQFRSPWAGVAGALAATFCRSSADFAREVDSAAEWLPFLENAVMRLIVYLTVVYAMLTYRRTLEVHRQRIEAMRRLLPVCHGCGSMRGPDGHWHSFDKLSQSPFPVVVECPTCERKTPPAPPTGEKT